MIIQTVEDIPEILKTPDSIFHFTKSSTAVEKIIFTEKLKMASIEKSKDPIEEECIRYLHRYDREPVQLGEYLGKYDVTVARRYITQEAKKAKQLCFSTNRNQSYRKKKTLNDYGFIKQRMWDQYGEQYAGVCLVLSQEVLKQKTDKLIWKKRKYVTYEQQMNNRIQLNNSDYSINGEINKNRIREKMVQYLNIKNIDYRDEQEIRALTFEDENEFIDISKCIKAIVICPDKMNNSFYARTINDYCEKKNIELVCLIWQKGNAIWDTRETRKEWGKIMKDIEKEMLDKKKEGLGKN